MFLGTTALVEFWDRTQELVLLGSWCLRPDRRPDWEDLRYRVLPSVWDDRDRFRHAADYVDACSEQTLARLTDYLNAVHGTSWPTRYWRVVVGPWLFHYVHALYDRYAHIELAFARWPDLQTSLLDPACFETPHDTVDWLTRAADDRFNLQLFSQLLTGLGFRFPALRPSERSQAEPAVGVSWTQKSRTAIRTLARVSERIAITAAGRHRQLALTDLYVHPIDPWRVAWRSRGRALPAGLGKTWAFPLPSAVFDQARCGLVHLPCTGPFERLLVDSLPLNLPTLYLEGYRSAREEILRTDYQPPRAIVSGVGWYFHERFKFAAAEARERGSRLLARQHGGGYGVFRWCPPEQHECRLADRFFVWGWGESGHDGRFSNLPDPTLSRLQRREIRPPDAAAQRTILFVATAHPRYLYRFQAGPVGSQWADYFEWQARFLRALQSGVRRTVLFRPYPQDYGHGVRLRLAESFPELHWDGARRIHRRFRRSRMVVIDHLATSLLEALAVNVPTVLFWDARLWDLRDAAGPYFARLRAAGILCESPEAAAARVRELDADLTAWWEPVVQDARRAFIDRFGLGHRDWLHSWVQTLGEAAPARS